MTRTRHNARKYIIQAQILVNYPSSLEFPTKLPMRFSAVLSTVDLVGQMWRRLAATGDPTALFNMGWMALQGYEVEKNGTAAYLLFGMV